MTTTPDMRPIHPLIAEAPDFAAWAGDGPAATAILESGDLDALDRLLEAASDAYWHADGTEVPDVEALAEQIAGGLSAECANCGEDIEWDDGPEAWVHGTTCLWSPGASALA